MTHRVPRSLKVALAAVLPVAAPALAFDPHLFVVGSEFGPSGTSAVVDLAAPWAVDPDVEPVGSDPKVRVFDDLIYVINRFGGDNIQIIDPETNQTVVQFSTGVGSNPQDILVLGPDRAYVTRYQEPLLWEVNPLTGDLTDTIDLSSFADADGIPEMAYMERDDHHVYVQIQRLNQDGFFEPVPPSYLAVIDIATNELVDTDLGVAGVQGIALAGLNPGTPMQRDPSAAKLHVRCLGEFGALDGGIEIIDLDALASEGWLITESELAGDVGPFVILDDTRGYVLTSDDFFFTTTLSRFDPSTGDHLGDIHTVNAYVDALAADPPSGQLFLPDRNPSAPGILVVDTDTDDLLTPSPIFTGLPPTDLVVVRPTVLDVGEVAGPLDPRQPVWAAPNPMRGSGTRVSFVARAPGEYEVTVFDAVGRRIRALSTVVGSASTEASVFWDGCDGAGRGAAPGVYAYRIHAVRGGVPGSSPITGTLVRTP